MGVRIIPIFRKKLLVGNGKAAVGDMTVSRMMWAKMQAG
jgi:hypothetical protein